MKEIKLSQDKMALVDDADFDAVKSIRWYAHKDKNTFYARTNISKKIWKSSVSMHVFLMGRSLHKLIIDHKNGDGLDNRRENLRFVSNRINCQNTIKRRSGDVSSHYVGVTWSQQKNKWRSQAQVKGKSVHLGFFKDQKKASEAYQEFIGGKDEVY